MNPLWLLLIVPAAVLLGVVLAIGYVVFTVTTQHWR